MMVNRYPGSNSIAISFWMSSLIRMDGIGTACCEKFKSKIHAPDTNAVWSIKKDTHAKLIIFDYLELVRY